MAEVGQKFDDVLRNLAGQAGSLEALLGAFFSFLHRNTDFYVTFDPTKTARAGMGFPAGKAEKLLLRAFRSFPYKSYGVQDEQLPAAAGRGRGPTSAKEVAATKIGPAGGSISRKNDTRSSPRDTKAGGVDTAPGRGGRAPAPQSSAAAAAAAAAAPSLPSASTPGEGSVAPSSTTTPPPEPPTTANDKPAAAAAAAAGGVSVRYTKDGKQVPIGNGGVTDRYYWTQTVNEATVYVDVPPGTRSKDVSCVIQPRWLKLKVRGAGAAGGAGAAAAAAGAAAAGAAAAGAEDVVFDGELPSAVSREDSMWSLNDGKTVVISFEKTTKSWWKSVVEGDPEIDTSKVDSTTKISEYDGETQGAIRKIMFDQRQKSLGLPTSDELNADALLERAKVLPGSPFLPGGVLFEGDSGAGVVGGGGDGLGPDGVC
ncbi:conserved unknown protein [Ectocarpus siliculosus]|uniref:CS domain-containing protein n=1 Tax=Ectocarpus siliculosus TaxID=2880 RepID=D8LL35_ECTSI|nr:conserved unknown protein [Ectocarpus siliculosus]|eukprot:CBN79652.1 conserved unknown protein [Ectocarpus siliculosus]